MIPILLVHPDLNIRQTEIDKILENNGFSQNHPDLLLLEDGEKLGIEQVRKIQEFLSLKPYQSDKHALVLVAAENLSLDAQNALLKTLEEPAGEAIIVLGAGSEEQLLPTITSRCHIINLNSDRPNTATPKSEKWQKEVERLLNTPIEQRFQFIEKLSEREEFLAFLVSYFRQKLLENPQPETQKFTTILMQGEKWAKQNVNIRAILEYLILNLPKS